ncbi:MAG: hypothetical protein MI808_18060 [Pseudomonadales bacterium]|nr:hypothetical protein [Pseudomonadales bacterium]
MAYLKEINPIVPVGDVIKSAEFFEGVLGFSSKLKESDIAIVCRDNACLRLVQADGDVGQLSCYIVVDGIDDLYNELSDKLLKLPENRVRPPFDQAYGMREFHVIDLDSLLIFFGEAIQ